MTKCMSSHLVIKFAMSQNVLQLHVWSCVHVNIQNAKNKQSQAKKLIAPGNSEFTCPFPGWWGCKRDPTCGALKEPPMSSGEVAGSPWKEKHVWVSQWFPRCSISMVYLPIKLGCFGGKLVDKYTQDLFFRLYPHIKAVCTSSTFVFSRGA